MVTRKESIPTNRMDNFKGGIGYMQVRHLLDAEKMYNKGRMFAHGILEKDCEVGWHVHQGDGETFYILSGEGEFNDNGEMTTVRAGDVCFTDEGKGHSLKNLKDEPLTYIALVLYK